MAIGFGFAPITSMHSARAFGAIVTLLDGDVLIAGGGVTEGPFSAELFSPATGSWAHSEMTTARSRNTATLLQTGQVLVVGGDTTTDPSTAEVFTSAANSWEKVFANLHSPRVAHTATVLQDGRVLVTGGVPSVFGPTLNTAEIFDPGSDAINGTWSVVNPMNEGRAFHTATLLPDGTVLVAGGIPDSGNSQVALASAELFDPATGTWTPTSPMTDTHSGHTATLLTFQPLTTQGDFLVLITGGMGSFGDISATAELYKPPPPIDHLPSTGEHVPAASVLSGSWVKAGSMNVTRMFHTATALSIAGGPLNRDRHVLVTGGPDPGNELSTGQTTEVYDLTADTWTLAGNMQTDRTGHMAAALSGDRVLLAGGLGGALGGPTDPAPSAEIGTMCSASAQVMVSPEQTLDFGQVHAGSEFNNSDFLPTVRNAGNAELTLQATISGPDAALFSGGPSSVIPLVVFGTGSCISGPSGGSGSKQVLVQFAAWSPVPKSCSATLTLSNSNATNVPSGQTWVFPMTAEIILSPDDVQIAITPPSFPETVVIGDTETGQLVITLESQISEAVSAVVRFPPPPSNSAFHWAARDYIIGRAVLTVSVPIDFRPLAAGPVTQTLQLISNAQGSPHDVTLHGTAKKGIVP